MGAVAPECQSRGAGGLRAPAVLEGGLKYLPSFGGAVLPGQGMAKQHAGAGTLVLRVGEGARVERQLEQLPGRGFGLHVSA